MPASTNHLLRIVYAAGPGDIVATYESWMGGQDIARETSVTFSGQFFDFCREHGVEGYAVASHPRARLVRDGRMVVEHRPKRGPSDGGLAYHVCQLRYGLSLMRTAVACRASAVVVDSGSTHWFALAPLRMLGIRVIPVMHNALWPQGYPPKRLIPRMIRGLNGAFWKYAASSTICVSPTLESQVREISGGRCGPIHQMRGQFRRGLLDRLPQPDPARRPFRVMFAGRVEHSKGVFDLLEIAAILERDMPGSASWDICGDGGALAELRDEIDRRRLSHVMTVHGRLGRDDMAKCYGMSSVVIVPTRSTFSEGLPLVIIEAILAGRPVITSRLSNALDVLGDAIVEAQPDDPSSYAAAASRLVNDRELFRQKQSACQHLQEQFYDSNNGFAAALERALSSAGIVLDNVEEPEGIVV